jgi:ApbE superfamily uncharacterized protein (UPF0280 family)
MRMNIQALRKGRPDLPMTREAAERAVAYFDRVAHFKSILSLPAVQIKNLSADDIAQKMLMSVRAVGDTDLTPMAAVAGTLADTVAQWLYDQGMTRVIVDNGGDIAVRLRSGEHVTVGVRPDLRSLEICHTLRLNATSASWGVTTSGFGGRSFTRGIASAVTAVGQTASAADAAATAIANACYIEDERIIQTPAEQLDPNTDLVGLPVTVRVGALEAEKYRQAIESALRKAERLTEQGLIFGTLIVAGGMFVMTEQMKRILA